MCRYPVLSSGSWKKTIKHSAKCRTVYMLNRNRGCSKMEVGILYRTASIEGNWPRMRKQLEIKVILCVVVANIFYHLADARHF